MRRTVDEQQRLVPIAIEHDHAHELRAISDHLDALPETLAWVYADLMGGGGDAERGRESMTAEQVLRGLIIKQMNGFSYEQLSFHLADSFSYRAFCRLGFDARRVPSKSALHRSFKRIRSSTLERINARLVRHAEALGIEDGAKVRVDCTVEESNIHEPTDSSLLWDSVRVLARLMHSARTHVAFEFVDHTRRAKRRAFGIQNAKSKAKRYPLYRELLRVTQRTIQYADEAVQQLSSTAATTAFSAAMASLASELSHYIFLAKKVIYQTQQRVLDGEAVHVSDKIVSIFEPHTDIIRKDRRETLYGHKLCLATGVSGLFLDCVVHRGNPADSKLAVAMIERQRDTYGRPPRQVSFDGGFSSKANLETLKSLQVKDVVFSKGPGLRAEDMATNPATYRMLRRFRAGIEAGISFLKRCFGLNRCTWKGLESFKAYTWASVVSANLLLLARRVLKA